MYAIWLHPRPTMHQLWVMFQRHVLRFRRGTSTTKILQTRTTAALYGPIVPPSHTTSLGAVGATQFGGFPLNFGALLRGVRA